MCHMWRGQRTAVVDSGGIIKTRGQDVILYYTENVSLI
jgi:hypothetical protein